MSFFFFGAVFVFFVGGANSVSTEVVLSTSCWCLGLLVVVLTLFACAGCSNTTAVASSAPQERLPLGAVLVAPFWAGTGGV